MNCWGLRRLKPQPPSQDGEKRKKIQGGGRWSKNAKESRALQSRSGRENGEMEEWKGDSWKINKEKGKGRIRRTGRRHRQREDLRRICEGSAKDQREEGEDKADPSASAKAERLCWFSDTRQAPARYSAQQNGHCMPCLHWYSPRPHSNTHAQFSVQHKLWGLPLKLVWVWVQVPVTALSSSSLTFLDSSSLFMKKTHDFCKIHQFSARQGGWLFFFFSHLILLTALKSVISCLEIRKLTPEKVK